MTELLSVPILPLILTLAAFQVGRVLQARFRSPFLNPILIAVILVLAFLFLHENFTTKSLLGCVLIGAGTLLMVL